MRATQENEKRYWLKVGRDLDRIPNGAEKLVFLRRKRPLDVERLHTMVSLIASANSF